MMVMVMVTVMMMVTVMVKMFQELQGRLTCLYSKLSPQQSLKLDL